MEKSHSASYAAAGVNIEAGYEGNINIDCSLVNDMNYYNGIAFKGFVHGVPASVLSGGRYDKLMERVNKKAGAIGFAVYLDEVDRLLENKEEIEETADDGWLNVALPKGRLGEKVYAMFESAGFVTGVIIPVDGGFSAYSGV